MHFTRATYNASEHHKGQLDQLAKGRSTPRITSLDTAYQLSLLIVYLDNEVTPKHISNNLVFYAEITANNIPQMF